MSLVLEEVDSLMLVISTGNGGQGSDLSKATWMLSDRAGIRAQVSKPSDTGYPASKEQGALVAAGQFQLWEKHVSSFRTEALVGGRPKALGRRVTSIREPSPRALEAGYPVTWPWGWPFRQQ